MFEGFQTLTLFKVSAFLLLLVIAVTSLLQFVTPYIIRAPNLIEVTSPNIFKHSNSQQIHCYCVIILSLICKIHVSYIKPGSCKLLTILCTLA